MKTTIERTILTADAKVYYEKCDGEISYTKFYDIPVELNKKQLRVWIEKEFNRYATAFTEEITFISFKLENEKARLYRMDLTTFFTWSERVEEQ